MRLAFFLVCFFLAAAASPAGANSDPHRAEARELLRRLIGYRSEIGRGQVPELARYLAAEFSKAGFPERDIHLLPLGETASLLVRYRGDGSGGRPIALMAHLDVVTAKPEDWQRDPYRMVEEGGYFFGRGTNDNKTGVALLTAAFLRLRREGFVPTRDLIIVFTGDEETEGLTAQDLLRNHRPLLDAEFALNSDGGGGLLDESGKAIAYGLQTAEKTYASFELTARNPGGHSSAPRAVNAFFELATALGRLQGYRFPVMWNDTTLAAFAASGASTSGELGAAMRRFAGNPRDAAAAEILSAVPSEVGGLRTTCVPTMLSGGHAENALPQSAVATVNCRIFPGVDVDAVRAALQEVVGKEIEVKGIGHPLASAASPLRDDVLAAVTRAIHAFRPGVAIVPHQAAGATDGVFFRAAGIPTYGVSGMFMKDSDSFAHGLNERVPVASFYDEMEYWYALLKDLAGK